MELSELREKIDQVDSLLLSLFLERMELCRLVAETKQRQGTAVRSEKREQEILCRVAEQSGDMAQYACGLYEAMFSLSREYQTKIMSETREEK